MQIDVQNRSGEVCGNIDIDFKLKDYNEALIHQVVDAFLKNARQGTRAQQTRAEVTGSSKKPWRQKGTGRARAGRVSSPLWRGGGRIFPNRPDENFSQKINKKMYRGAMASIISKIIDDNRIKVVDKFDFTDHKTKSFAECIEHLSLHKTDLLLIVHPDEMTENFYYASRNVRKVFVLESDLLNPYLLLRYRNIVCTKQAFESHVLSYLRGVM
jgi:large subunit ribosomal protein L4